VFVKYLGFLGAGEWNQAEVLEEGLMRLLEFTPGDRAEVGTRNSFWVKLRRIISL
jgi:hypothetical protein